VEGKNLSIELFNEETDETIAKSRPFVLDDVLAIMSPTSNQWRIGQDGEEYKDSILMNGSTCNCAVIEFNNLAKNSSIFGSTQYRKTFDFKLVKVSRFKKMSLFSFFSKTSKVVVPMIGVDFSDSNWGFCDGDILHSVEEDNPQIYSRLLKSFSEVIKFISIESIYPYFFGCKINDF